MLFDFTEGIDALGTILENQNSRDFTKEDLYLEDGTPRFDSILFKRLKKWSIIDENAIDKKTRDSDIRFEGVERHIFPVYENLMYKNENEGKGYYKRWFLTAVDFRFSLENVNYMYSRAIETSFNNEDLDYFQSEEKHTVHLSKEARNTERVFLGYKEKDSPAFTRFRHLLFENDFVVICKLNQKNEYTLLGVKEDDLVGTNLNRSRSTFVHSEAGKKSASTIVNASSTVEIERLSPDIPYQRMFVGPPGIGKSFYVKDESHKLFKPENITTVTFFQKQKYSKFIGTYKPMPSEGESEGTRFDFQPGLFLSRLVEAMKHPNSPYLFIIEEINRGDANDIFGDFFQLLERQGDGTSRYSLDVEPDILRYLKKEKVFENGKIYLPNNFFLWATCNLSDQHTLSMDNSFLRRWDRTFIHLDHFEKGADFSIKLPAIEKPIAWNKIRHKINNELMNFSYIQEDQLLGPFFIQSDQDENEFFSNIIVHLKENVMGEMAEELFVNKFLSRLYDTYHKGQDVFLTIKWDEFIEETD